MTPYFVPNGKTFPHLRGKAKLFAQQRLARVYAKGQKMEQRIAEWRMSPEARKSKRRNTPKRACCGRPVTRPHNLACVAVGGPGVGKWAHRTRKSKSKNDPK